MSLPSRRNFLLTAGVGAGAVVAGVATASGASAASPAAAAATVAAPSGAAKKGLAVGTLCYIKNDHTLAVLVGDREIDLAAPSIVEAIRAAALEV